MIAAGMLDYLNKLFAIPLVSVLVGVLAGGWITWFVAWLYYKKAGDELRAEASRLHRISQMILGWLEAKGENVSVIRGEDGKETGLKHDKTFEVASHPEATVDRVVIPKTDGP